MNFDNLKENSGVYLYQDEGFNTITLKLNFLGRTDNRSCAISDVLSYYMLLSNKNFEDDVAINQRKKELYELQCHFINKFYSRQKVFSLYANFVSPAVLNDDYYKDVFEFIRQILKEPDFTNEELLDYCKRSILSNLELQFTDNEEYADSKYNEVVLGEENRVYEYSTDMDYITELINSITLDELKDAYEYIMSHFQSGIVFGNISEDKFNEFVSTMSLPPRVKDVHYERDINPPTGDEEIIRDSEQSYIYVTYDMGHVSYPQLRLLLNILNSSLGLCYQTLREQHGLVYSSYAAIMYYLNKIYFYGEIDPSKKQEYLDAVEEIVSKLQDRESLETAINNSKIQLGIRELTISENQDEVVDSLDDYALGLYEGQNRNEIFQEIADTTVDDILTSTMQLKRRHVLMVRSGEDE